MLDSEIAESLPQDVYRICERMERYGEALRNIASYNADELREWEEENAADMVEMAEEALK